MDHDYDTQSLAKAYELQGHHREALDIYVRMNRKSRGRNPEILAACNRLEKILEKKKGAAEAPRPGLREKRSLPALMEQWLALWLIRQRKTALDTLMLTRHQNRINHNAAYHRSIK